MKKFTKSLIALSLIISVLASFFCFTASAAGTSISLSKSSLTVGDSLTATVTFDAGEAMYGVEGVVNYDSSVLEFVSSSNASGGAGSLRIIEAPSGETKVSYSITFKALKAGSASISMSDCNYEALGENGATSKAFTASSASVTVKDVTLSGNANLSSMRISAGALSPAFSPSTTNYNVSVPNSVTELKIYVTTADSAATVSVQGSAALKIGSNTRTVVVTAPNGTQKSYTLNITRSETEAEPDEPEDPEENPLETVIDGATYTIVNDLSSVPLFSGFTASKTDFNGTEVSVAVDADNVFVIYYLQAPDSTDFVPYTYNADAQVFEKLKYLTQGENSYIIAPIPEGFHLPDGYYKTTSNIASLQIDCYATGEAAMSDFSYIYCFTNGRYGFYRYDTRENVLQRYPELELLSVDAEVLDEDENSAGGLALFISRFMALTNNAKIIIVSLAVLILCAIILVVLLIVKFSKKNLPAAEEDDILDLDDFDNTTVIDGFTFAHESVVSSDDINDEKNNFNFAVEAVESNLTEESDNLTNETEE